MEVNNLNSKWGNISDFRNYKGYKALRISIDCIPDLFIATDNDGHRCLLLFLPSGIEVKLRDINKQNLGLTYLRDNNVIIIKLNVHDFIDLFNDLIISLYSKIKKIQDPNKYSEEFIYSFNKWAEFFVDKSNSKLSDKEIQGLFGEIFVLSEFIFSANISNVNSFLEAWKGLYGSANDFVFDKKNMEVKTKKESIPFVKVSSEFQLEKEIDKGLELLILSIKIDFVNGTSIYDQLLKLVHVVRSKLGDLSIIYYALSQMGLTLESTKEYNNHRFSVVKKHIYDCTKDNFPKLSISNLPDGITNLSYNLRVSALSDFLIEEKNY